MQKHRDEGKKRKALLHLPGLVELIRNRDWANVILKLSTHKGKQEARIQDDLQWLPLHVACCCRYVPVQVIDALIQEYPQSAALQDESLSLPIHYACQWGSSSEVVRVLLQAHPPGAWTPDEKGFLPLHRLCVGVENSIQTLHLLAKRYPKAVEMADRRGNMPLHLALLHRAPSPFIVALLRQCPNAARRKNKRGQLPIHIATRNKRASSMLVIRNLLDVFPDGTRLYNKCGKSWSGRFLVYRQLAS